MSFKTSAGHKDRFVVKAEVSIPRNPAIENNPVMNGNIRTKDSVTGDEKQKNTQFRIRGWKNQPEKVSKFCFNK